MKFIIFQPSTNEFLAGFNSSPVSNLFRWTPHPSSAKTFKRRSQAIAFAAKFPHRDFVVCQLIISGDFLKVTSI